MFLRTVNIRSCLPIFKHYYCNRLLHISHSNYTRKAASKSALDDCNAEFFENIDSPRIELNSNKNFFGIESDEGVIIIDPLNSNGEQLSGKLHAIKEESREKFYRASFGVIRQDSDNKLNVHGQYQNVDSVFPYKSTEFYNVFEKTNKISSSTLRSLYNKSNYNQKLHYNKLHSENCMSNNSNFETVIQKDVYQPKTSDKIKCSTENQDLNYIDESFFGNIAAEKRENSNISNNERDKISTIESNYLEEHFFMSDVNFKNCMSDEIGSLQNNLEHENDEYLSNKDISDEGRFQNTTDRNMSSMNNLNESETSSEYFLNKFDIKNSTECIVKNGTEDNVLVDTKISHIKDFQELKVESSRDFVPESNKVLTQVDFENKQRDVISDKISKNQFKLTEKIYTQSNKISPTSYSNGKSDKTVNFPKTDELDIFERDCAKENIGSTDKLSDAGQITTALEFVTKIRKEQKVENQAIKKVGAESEVKLDSKGFRILTNQVPDLSHFTQDEIMLLLKDNIIYSDDNLLILNKPYSLVLHDSETTQYPCLSLFLDDLAKDIDHKTTDPKLYTVHRLDKETTGCLLLARNEYMADHVKSLFAQRKVIKKYWILTSQVPDPLQGVIDIPISEGSIQSRKRMVLHPQLPKDIPYRNHSKAGKRAVTLYKVLCVSGNAALVEVTPKTGIKHQIRVHFGFGLSCPILGDHKYSHLDKMAPQKLPCDLLQKLHIRQSKVRHIPMHIHAHSITIPGYLDGRDLYISAPLPSHMRVNLTRLKLKKRNSLVF